MRRIQNIAVSFGVAAAIAPLGFSCHSRTDQSAAVTQQSDDEDQTVRAMASVATPSEADGAIPGEAKVRLSSDVTTGTISKNNAGRIAKLSASDDVIISKGSNLLALYDNECRREAGRLSSKVSASLHFEAEQFSPPHDMTFAALSAEAEADPCLVRVDENRAIGLFEPFPESARGDFSSQAESLTAFATTNDPRLTEAMHITFSKALQSWDWFYSGVGIKTDVIVAIVDSGILYTHPDLAENVYTDANGLHGYDFINGDSDPLDDFGHGTHVAGIVGARANNGIGVTGVIGSKVKLMGIKSLDAEGGGTEASIVNGIRFAADNGAHVINMSFGGSGTSSAIRDAIVYAANKGVVIVMAAGNSGAELNGGAGFVLPACYAKDIPGSIAVGSVDAVTGARSTFSNFSSTYVWIAAPGSNGILSTYTGDTYRALQGTSMASPVVAGAAALVVGSFRANSIAYSPADVVNILTESAQPVSSLAASFRNGATLDIERAAKLFFSRYIMAGNGGTEVQ